MVPHPLPLSSFNTVNGKYCYNWLWKILKFIAWSFNTVNGKYCYNAVKYYHSIGFNDIVGFNTVNGKYCYNYERDLHTEGPMEVSIP